MTGVTDDPSVTQEADKSNTATAYISDSAKAGVSDTGKWILLAGRVHHRA